MARVRVHALCLRPLSECDCPDDDDGLDDRPDEAPADGKDR